jgi:hypothetical protein
VSSSPRSARSTPRTRRSSVSASSAFARMLEKLAASSSGGSGTRWGAASAWIAITDR